MTEADWLGSLDPDVMLHDLRRKANRTRWLFSNLGLGHCPPTVRKARLFACACCRRVWPLLTHELARTAVETSERYADGLVSRDELLSVNQRVAKSASSSFGEVGVAVASPDAWGAAETESHLARVLAGMNRTAGGAKVPENLAGVPAFEAGREQEGVAQSHLLRDIFGNPFRPPPVSIALCTGKDDRVMRLALAIYLERRFDELPALADALVHAGCRDDEVIAHCRLHAEHVRGCWVIDALLGKR